MILIIFFFNNRLLSSFSKRYRWHFWGKKISNIQIEYYLNLLQKKKLIKQYKEMKSIKKLLFICRIHKHAIMLCHVYSQFLSLSRLFRLLFHRACEYTQLQISCVARMWMYLWFSIAFGQQLFCFIHRYQFGIHVYGFLFCLIRFHYRNSKFPPTLLSVEYWSIGQIKIHTSWIGQCNTINKNLLKYL